MNARFTTHMSYPRVDLIPDGEFTFFRAMVEVHFLKFDSQTGKQDLAPFIRCNCSFGDLTPDEASAWAKTLEVAGDLAKNRPRPSWDVPNEVWIDGVKKRKPPKYTETLPDKFCGFIGVSNDEVVQKIERKETA